MTRHPRTLAACSRPFTCGAESARRGAHLLQINACSNSSFQIWHGRSSSFRIRQARNGRQIPQDEPQRARSPPRGAQADTRCGVKPPSDQDAHTAGGEQRHGSEQRASRRQIDRALAGVEDRPRQAVEPGSGHALPERRIAAQIVQGRTGPSTLLPRGRCVPPIRGSAAPPTGIRARKHWCSIDGHRGGPRTHARDRCRTVAASKGSQILGGRLP